MENVLNDIRWWNNSGTSRGIQWSKSESNQSHLHSHFHNTENILDIKIQICFHVYYLILMRYIKIWALEKLLFATLTSVNKARETQTSSRPHHVLRAGDYFNFPTAVVRQRAPWGSWLPHKQGHLSTGFFCSVNVRVLQLHSESQ